MSEIATYTFLPWLREGLANQITGQSGERATIPVELVLTGHKADGSGTESRPPIQRDVEIYGPGDLTGLDTRAIIKTEPHHWITNFEPNYLPYLELYDGDLPWRYSPVAPGEHRLQPWIVLVVLKEEEFSDGKNVKDRPLPYILTNSDTKLPPSDQLWAWAHVHINTNLIGSLFLSTDVEAIQSAAAAALDANPDVGYSRIVCPRRLEANTAYHAFLVPSFESGRLAGLGQDPAGAAAVDAPAWSESVVPSELPVYHRWYFRTGSAGDFEYLVRLLEPQPIDSRVGVRDLDVQRPGANIVGIVDAPGASEEQRLGGILKLGGALRIPDIFYTPEEFAVVQKYDRWATLNGTQPPPHPFQADLAAFVDLSDDYQEKGAAEANGAASIHEEQPADDPETEYEISRNPDPLITAPLYGRWHSLTQRLLKDRQGADLDPNDNWVHELNLDPRWRSAAGFGTAVVQDNQEDYMQAAWEQVGEVLESNRTIRFAQLAKAASFYWYQTHLRSVREKQPDRWLALSAPLHARVLTESTVVEGERSVTRRVTVRHRVDGSRVPRAALSTTMRKQLRPRGPLARRLRFDRRASSANLIGRIDRGEVSAAPPRETPASLDGHAQISEAAIPDDVPELVRDPLSRHPWLRWLPLGLALLLFLVLGFAGAAAPAWLAGAAVAGGLVYAWRRLSSWSSQLRRARSVLPENQVPEAIDAWPKSPDFKLSVGDAVFRPTFGSVDSEEATRFKAALKDVHALVQRSLARSVPVTRAPLDIAATAGRLFEALDPAVTIPQWVWAGVRIPGRIKDQLEEAFVEAMAYPEIDLPMYKPLAERSPDLFLPNIQHIAQNSISLLETNQRFIEAYMVGLNHEFARELLWREYPTDQRGSYFRQFWEARGFYDDQQLDAEALKEKLRDIPPLHLWSKFSKLGDHDNREEGGDKEEEVVLVIRGELLKKYPNAVIYAHRAVWKDSQGDPIVDPEEGQVIDPTKERDLYPISESEQASPSRTLVKTPLYEAKVAPDITFFGFDLTVCKAKGGTGKESVPVDERCAAEGVTWDDPGWFFVIKERPGEPRFGLDIGGGGNVEQGRIEVWNDLAWGDISPPVAAGGFLQISGETQTITANQPLESEDAEKIEQQEEDGSITWSQDMSSAELAYILYQVPVLVAVHAVEMLPQH